MDQQNKQPPGSAKVIRLGVSTANTPEMGMHDFAQSFLTLAESLIRFERQALATSAPSEAAPPQATGVQVAALGSLGSHRGFRIKPVDSPASDGELKALAQNPQPIVKFKKDS